MGKILETARMACWRARAGAPAAREDDGWWTQKAEQAGRRGHLQHEWRKSVKKPRLSYRMNVMLGPALCGPDFRVPVSEQCRCGEDHTVAPPTTRKLRMTADRTVCKTGVPSETGSV